MAESTAQADDDSVSHWASAIIGADEEFRQNHPPRAPSPRSRAKERSAGFLWFVGLYFIARALFAADQGAWFVVPIALTGSGWAFYRLRQRNRILNAPDPGS